MIRANYLNVSAKKTVEQWKNINQRITKKIKGTIFEKWVQYWKQIAKDYTEVTISVKQEMKEKPFKSALYVTGIGLLGCCVTNNPNLQSFRAKYVQCANDLALVSSSVSNPVSVEHLKYVEKCFNTNELTPLRIPVVMVVLIFGVAGACRGKELHQLTISDVTDMDHALLVNVRNTKIM
ncbi:hypothetical protein NQ315_016589 [Exocentrus adspersus]|uniref:Uncharacterized protein n=1 Tax=Exocentrus adspersus TaxID=1586481 RepID=A0AAV8V9T1_9CUCU|nr:hypothetical protein NQ315_016589 [Exocentrus adspersus]